MWQLLSDRSIEPGVGMTATNQGRPAVSVLVPVYNNNEFIESALESLLRQSMADFEVVVVDDGSTDGTAKILSSYRDPRIRIHSHSCRKGVAAARNTAVSLARGDFFAWMDGDDISLPTRLERQLQFLKANPSISAVGSDLIPMDEEGRPNGKAWAPPESPMLIKWGYLFGTPMFNGTTMVRRDLYDVVGRYNDQLRVGEDNEFWLRCSWAAELANLNEVLLCYRRHPGNATSADHERSAELGTELTRNALMRLTGEPVEHRVAHLLRVPGDITLADVREGVVRAAVLLLGSAAERFDLLWSPNEHEAKLLRESRSAQALRLWAVSLRRAPRFIGRSRIFPPFTPTGFIDGAVMLGRRRLKSLGTRSDDFLT
jgi:hypothetical protein